jgi:uncharacterized protein (DUF1330 family)
MAKGYWVVAYRSVSDPGKLAAYGKLAAPAITSAGGRFLVRGGQVTPHEVGQNERTVVVEFPSYSDALAAHESPAYQEALVALDGGAERDLRITEGVE